jgi:PhzF family phenazine biosynthesis protein
MAVYGAEGEVRDLRPDFALLSTCEPFGVIATAAGSDCDFVSRFFAPAAGIPEDPVTGSAHCTLAPFWAARLGRKKLHARQVSRRGGELWVEDRGERVSIAGRAVLVIEGTLLV